MNIIQRIINNKDKIVGIRLDGTYYDVDAVTVDDVDTFDMLAPDDTIVYAYQIEDSDMYVGYAFTVEDIKKAKEVKLYELKEI